jgi:hypothetical protein
VALLELQVQQVLAQVQKVLVQKALEGPTLKVQEGSPRV